MYKWLVDALVGSLLLLLHVAHHFNQITFKAPTRASSSRQISRHCLPPFAASILKVAVIFGLLYNILSTCLFVCSGRWLCRLNFCASVVGHFVNALRVFATVTL